MLDVTIDRALAYLQLLCEYSRRHDSPTSKLQYDLKQSVGRQVEHFVADDIQ